MIASNRKIINPGDFILDHNVRLLSGGKAYFELLAQLIDQARECIHLQVYIYEADTTGQLIADALTGAAGRGVAVYVLVDGYGSQGLDKSIVAQFKEHGVRFRVFEPLLRSKHFYVGRRMHQKVLVVDARYVLVTGANIGDKYNDLPGHAAWLDFALCVEGAVAAQVCRACWATWKNFRPFRRPPVGCIPASTVIDFGAEDRGAVRLRRNDWVRRKHDISRTYREIFGQARERVVLLSSYFLPGSMVRGDIEAAAKRGVRIQLIICSRMDVPLVKDAERFMYGWLMKQGVEIYEYTGSMLHGKLATCDGEWITLGSFNVNDLSARVSIELNLDVRGEAVVQRALRELECLMRTHCLRVSRDHFEAESGFFSVFLRWLAFRILRIIFFLGTFYMRQEKRMSD